ncbi:MAG: hypothetical protein K1X94_12100 [Sandaracinaceae bacterium]|nr:hypothetical protein [Sandaracinaceae bacterium]
MLALALCCLTPSLASAQATEDEQLDEARGLRAAGIALTVSGVATAGVGTGLMLGVGDWGGVIGGGTLEGLGGVLSLIGIPMWIVGAARVDVLSASLDARDRIARGYEVAGIVVTSLGLAMAIAGAALMGVAASGSSNFDQTFLPSVVMLPAGAFLAAFIGAPLWAEGARF